MPINAQKRFWGGTISVYLASAMLCKAVAIAGLVCLPGVMEAYADDLTLAVGGKSEYQIIVPNALPNKAIARQVYQAGRAIQNAFKANGCSVPVVAEKDRNPAKPGIYLSTTEYARANGVDFSKLEGWGYVHKVVERM